ncbi:hypothetical protein [Litchfieldia alkalitelluris]|uniref:hypothetical protein n=1 Tax=Litchfieldia alkalitelluris TaxID=304268 RepID=UPI000996C065|nr:hypothetical protein [Litchfieldia alkalitelluris]
MKILNKIALFFVVLYSVIIIMNTYLNDFERIQTNVVILLMNGFAYIVSSIELEREKENLTRRVTIEH